MQSLDCHKNTRKFIYEYLSALDCPRALTAYLMFENGEHKQLSELEFDPVNYDTLEKARDSLAATKILSKATFLKTGNDLKSVAMQKFEDAELACRTTNESMINLGKKPKLAAVLLALQFKISKILGDFDCEEFVDACNFGPGSSTSIKRRQANHPNKFQFETGITQPASDFCKPWFNTVYPLWEVDFKIEVGGKVVTVPKNAKTDRVIMIEPGLNLWFQKGLGEMLRKRLRYSGIDLSDQRINAGKSRIASIFNDVATVDFSSASDTISSKLIEEVMPPDWFSVLNAFRSRYAIVEGKPRKLEKFSSMGNGFTFELESLIFYCLSCVACDEVGVCSRQNSVYGDDVILPTTAFESFHSMSKLCGFTVNHTKSYASGDYRESCGAHYWNGSCIKPIFLKEELDEEEVILRCANRVREYASRRRQGGCDKRLRKTWIVLTGMLSLKTPRICIGYGDIGLIVNSNEPGVNPRTTKRSETWEGHYHKVWSFVPMRRTYDHRGFLLYKLKSLGAKSYVYRFNPLDITEASCIGNDIPMPMATKCVLKDVFVPQWADIGEWI